MKRLLLVTLLICSCWNLLPAQTPASPDALNSDNISDLGPPAHPATADQIREYLALTHSEKVAHTAMQAMLKASRATSASYYSPAFWDDMEQAMMNLDIVGPCIPAFQKYFSQEDMAATISFYKTPAGQRLLSAQPFIASALGEVLHKAGEQAGYQVGMKHKAEIEQLMKEHPQVQPAVITKAN